MSLHIFKSKHGFEMQISSHGMSLKKLDLPWGISPVVGFLEESDYENNPLYHGATVGRMSNRVANSKLLLRGKEYLLSANEKANHLHGGTKGLSKANWEVGVGDSYITGTYTSPDGEDGYPGEVEIFSSFSFIENSLKIHDLGLSKTYSPLSITHHPYFSFGGGFEDMVLNVFCNEYLEVDADLIPTGKVRDFDPEIDEESEEEIVLSNFDLKEGIDTCFVYPYSENELRKNAELIDLKSKTKITVWSDYPAFQIYTSINQLDNVSVPVGAACVCIEPQYMTGFNQHAHFKGFYFDGKNYYKHTIVYEFDQI